MKMPNFWNSTRWTQTLVRLTENPALTVNLSHPTHPCMQTISATEHSIGIHVTKKRILKLWSVISKCHRLILRSSADIYVSWSLFTDIEFMWYVCALANTRRGLASTISSIGLNTGTRNVVIDVGSRIRPLSSFRL